MLDLDFVQVLDFGPNVYFGFHTPGLESYNTRQLICFYAAGCPSWWVTGQRSVVGGGLGWWWRWWGWGWGLCPGVAESPDPPSSPGHLAFSLLRALRTRWFCMGHARAAAQAASSQPPTPLIHLSIHPSLVPTSTIQSPPPQSQPPRSPSARQCCMTGQTHSPSAGQILLQLPGLLQRGSDLVSPGRGEMVPSCISCTMQMLFGHCTELIQHFWTILLLSTLASKQYS